MTTHSPNFDAPRAPDFSGALVQAVGEQAALANAVSVEVTAKDLMYEKVDLTDGVYYYNGNEITYWGLLPGGRLELDTLNVDCVQEVQLPHTFLKAV